MTIGSIKEIGVFAHVPWRCSICGMEMFQEDNMMWCASQFCHASQIKVLRLCLREKAPIVSARDDTI